MRYTLNKGQQTLNNMLIKMCEEVERIMIGCMECLKNMDRDKVDYWMQEDQLVNDLEWSIDNECVRLIATQHPVAKDLRKIVSAIRISTDLERMSDLAVGVAKTVRRIDEPLCMPLTDILLMEEKALEMMRLGIEAYRTEDMEMARSLAGNDDEVDGLCKRVLTELQDIMMKKPECSVQGIQLVIICRYLERFADHATNIGESVIYIATAERTELNN